MSSPVDLKDMQRYVARIAITASTLRGQGASGLVEKAREFLAAVDLNRLAAMDPSSYATWLENQTKSLKNEFGGDRWGSARKSINIFMTMAALNRFLCAAYALERLEKVFEVPLDNIVAKTLLKFEGTPNLFAKDKAPKWKNIKDLKKEASDDLQAIAAVMANKLRIPRGRLDIALWTRRRGHS